MVKGVRKARVAIQFAVVTLPERAIDLVRLQVRVELAAVRVLDTVHRPEHLTLHYTSPLDVNLLLRSRMVVREGDVVGWVVVLRGADTVEEIARE